MAKIVNKSDLISDQQIVDEIAQKIAFESPTLADIPLEQLHRIAASVVFDDLKDKLRIQAEAARININKEWDTFIKIARSKHTARAYQQSLERLDKWCQANGKTLVILAPKDADDYIYAISAEGRSPASIGLDISAASAFFTWLERRHNIIRNPFRGTRARPRRKAKKTLLIPDENDMQQTIGYFSGSTKAAVVVMAKAGFRVGALTTLTIRDGKYTCITKGKEQKGILTPEIIKVLKPLGSRPFAERTPGGIAESVKYGIYTLFEKGLIKAKYSCHDFRHYYAVQEYSRDKDIYRISKLLGHCNISITQQYLRGLDILDN